MDYLLYDITGLVDFCLAPESDESSDDVSNKSSEKNKDKEPDKISIYFYAVCTCYCSVPYVHVLVTSLYHYNSTCLPILP